MTSRINILGVPIDAVTMREAIERIRELLQSGQQHQVCTPNPEMLCKAAQSREFLEVLRSSSLNVPDGSGLLWAAKHCGEKLPARVAGVDLLEQIVDLPEVGSIFFLGGWTGIAERTANVLSIEHPNITVAGTFAGSPRPEDAENIVHSINTSGAKTLLVAYGAPAQELWIHRHLPSMPNVKLAIGVGGSFDFLAKEVPRAPMWMRERGIEWLWRLMLQPHRLPRIVNATMRFPALVRRYGAVSPLSADARTK